MSARDRSLLGIVVLVLIAVVGYYALIAPKRSQASSLQAQIASQESALTSAQSQLSDAVRARTRYTAVVRSMHQAVQTAVPNDPQVPELINELQAAATRAHVTFKTIAGASGSSSASGTQATTSSTTAATAATGFPSSSLSLEFDGMFANVASVLGDIQGFVRVDNGRFGATGRLIAITSVTLSPQGKSVTATVTATDYQVPDALTRSGSAAVTSTAATEAADITAR